jgi:hypothetical protein
MDVYRRKIMPFWDVAAIGISFGTPLALEVVDAFDLASS